MMYEPKKLFMGASLLAVSTLPSYASAAAMCGATTTTGNNLTLGQTECISGNGLYFYVDIEKDGTPLNISTSGGTGEADILVNTGNWATASAYTERTQTPGTNDSLQITANQGRLYISVFGAHEQVQLALTQITSEQPTTNKCTETRRLSGEIALNEVACIGGNGLYYYVDVPEDNTELTIETQGGKGEADIFVNNSGWATRSSYTASSANAGTNETLKVTANKGLFYVSVVGQNDGVNFSVKTGTSTLDPVNPTDPATADFVVVEPVVVSTPAAAINSKAEFSVDVEQIIASTWAQWGEISANSPGVVADVAKAIHFLAQQDDIKDKDLDTLLYFLRNFAANGDFTQFSQADAKLISDALHAVAMMTEFYTTGAPAGLIHESYATALINLTTAEGAQFITEQLPHLMALTQFYAGLSNPYVNDNFGYSTNQILKAFYDLAYIGKQNAVIKAAFNEHMLAVMSVLRSYALGETGLDMRWNADADRMWIMPHEFLALGHVVNLAEPAVQARFDGIVKEIFDVTSAQVDAEEVKKKITESYLETVNRSCDSSDALNGYCSVPKKVEDILTITYQCNDAITISAQAMTNQQLATACSKMADVGTNFHQFFNTNMQPVSDDNNTKLEVIVYATPEDYEAYGYQFFGHNTNNGGIYLEGDPSIAGNIPRFHAMQCPQSWVGFSCDTAGEVYNLEHEYIHYLDGRYNLYGMFAHHNNTVSWAEGWAEFLTKGQYNKRNFDAIAGKTVPSLRSILFMEYGFDNLYPWSYLTMRYLAENHKQSVLALSNALK